ncbi:MAG: C-terminal binding protein [Candidatus Methylomirabilales bacterium]
MTVVIIEGERPSLLPEGPVLEGEVLGPGIEVLRYGLLETIPRDVLSQAEAIIVRPGVRFGREEINRLDCCRVLISLGVGVEHIDLAAAGDHDLPVSNVPDYGVDEVADTALAMMLYLHRRLGAFYRHARFRGMEWDWRVFGTIRRARETTVGVVGLGRIGTSVALKAKACGYHVIFFDPFVHHETAQRMGITQVRELVELLRMANIVTIHTPLTPETYGMIDAGFIAQMKHDAILINVSRGEILKSLDVLYDALRQRETFAAGLDVLPIEPPVPHPLLDAWQRNEEWICGRFLLTPHAAFYSEDACQELRRNAAQIAKAVLDGLPPYNVVNR